MRMIVMLVGVLIVSLLIFKGYSSRLVGPGAGMAAPLPGSAPASTSVPAQLDPVSRAKEVNPLLEEAAEARRKALEQQLQ